MKTDKPLLSIVIPFFNAGNLINHSINSLLKQTNKDFEVILVNDGSTDQTKEIALDLLTDSNLNFKILDKENAGVSSARNYGLLYTTGKYVYFLDSDDMVSIFLVERLLDFIDSNKNCEVVVFGYNVLNYNQELIRIEDLNGYQKVGDSRCLLIDILKMRTAVHTESIVYRKSFLDDNALLFNENMKFGEDQEFSLKAIYLAEKAGCLNEQLAFYIKHLNATTSTVFNRSRFGMLEKYDHFKDILHDNENYLSVLSDNGKVISATYISYMICNSFSFGQSMKEISFMRQAYLADIEFLKISLKAKVCYTVMKYLPILIYITKSLVAKFMFPISNANKNK